MPVDGTILEGSCAADESMLTGESRLVAKAPGSSVTGGTVNYEGPVTVRATSTGQESTLAGGRRRRRWRRRCSCWGQCESGPAGWLAGCPACAAALLPARCCCAAAAPLTASIC
jgi:magnesium-transporting ATPase (P-type)